jgi:hypothetical protein
LVWHLPKRFCYQPRGSGIGLGPGHTRWFLGQLRDDLAFRRAPQLDPEPPPPRPWLPCWFPSKQVSHGCGDRNKGLSAAGLAKRGVSPKGPSQQAKPVLTSPPPSPQSHPSSSPQARTASQSSRLTAGGGLRVKLCGGS